MTWDQRYRPLEPGELIKEGDEVMTDAQLGWLPAGSTIGQEAPDPFYSSHRMYRRLNENNRVAALERVLDRLHDVLSRDWLTGDEARDCALDLVTSEGESWAVRALPTQTPEPVAPAGDGEALRAEVERPGASREEWMVAYASSELKREQAEARATAAEASLAETQKENDRLQTAMLVFGAYLMEKGEDFRTGEGAELLDAYSAALASEQSR